MRAETPLLHNSLAAREKQLIMLQNADHDIHKLLLPSNAQLPESAYGSS